MISIRCIGISKHIGRLKYRWVHLKQRRYVYSWYKFGGLLSSTSADNAAYSRHRSALGLIHLYSLGGSTFVFRYHSLGGDTAMPGGLYAGLCHAFHTSRLYDFTMRRYIDRCTTTTRAMYIAVVVAVHVHVRKVIECIWTNSH